MLLEKSQARYLVTLWNNFNDESLKTVNVGFLAQLLL